MKLRLNGEETELPGDLRTLPEVVAALGLAPETLLIEHNGTALHRAEWEGRLVKEGDALEILRIAAGG